MLPMVHPLEHKDVQEVPFLEACSLLYNSAVAIHGDVAWNQRLLITGYS